MYTNSTPAWSNFGDEGRPDSIIIINTDHIHLNGRHSWLTCYDYLLLDCYYINSYSI